MLHQPTCASPLFMALLGVAGWLPAVAQNLQSLPTGGVVRSGAATIVSDLDSARMTIRQDSDRVAIDWTRFNIAPGAMVRFEQPGAGSVALNRVAATGGVSYIGGDLTANGHVFLLNPNGVLFGSSAKVDVGGLVASSLTLAQEDFEQGRYRLVRGERAGPVVNQGRLQARPGGSIALIAPQVYNLAGEADGDEEGTVYRGSITAELGTIALAAGDQVTLDFTGDRLIRLAVDQRAFDARVVNRGDITALGGRVIMSAQAEREMAALVVNNTDLRVAAFARVDGELVRLEDSATLAAGGNIKAAEIDLAATRLHVSGQLAADGADAGGRITLRGEQAVLLADGSALSAASGAGHGGTIDVRAPVIGVLAATLSADGALSGGQVRLEATGADAAGLPASLLYLDGEAIVRADATQHGTGGSLLFLSDDHLRLAGSTTARGGVEGGDGGLVLAAADGLLLVDNLPDAAARGAGGAPGRLLLTQPELRVASTLCCGEGGAPAVPVPGHIDPALIEAVAARGTAVHLRADQDLHVDEGVQLAAGAAPLTLQADGDLYVHDRLHSEGSGNALVLAGRRLLFDEALPAQPMTTPNGRWLAYSRAPESNVFHQVRSPGNLFGRSIGDNPPEDIAPEFGSRFVYGITPTLTVTAQPGQRLYGAANPDFGYTVQGLVDGDTAASTLRGALGSDADIRSHAGAYTIGQGSLADRLGYQLEVVEAPLQVMPRPITLTVNDGTRHYGNANPLLGGATLTAGELVFGDQPGSLAVTSSLPATAHAGAAAPLVADAWAPSGGSNASVAGDYAVTLLPGTLTVTPRPITLTVDDSTRHYGDANPLLGSATAGAGGLVFGDRIAGVSVSSPLAAAAHAGDTAALHGTGFTLDAATSLPSDYAVEWRPGTLSVTPRPVTVSIDDQGRTFRAPNPQQGSASVADGALAFGDQIGALPVHSALDPDAVLGASAPLSGAAVTLLPGENGSRASDYAFTVLDGTLHVDALPRRTPEAGSLAATPPQLALPSEPHLPPAGTRLVSVAEPVDGSLAHAPEQFLAEVASRHASFTELFATSLQVLRDDPAAADLPPCPEGTADRRGTDEELCMPRGDARLAVDEGTPVALEGQGELQFPPPAAGVPNIERKRAWLIGINAYQGEIPRLRTPLADADAVGRELKERYGYEVELLRNATRRDIFGLFRRIVEETGPGDSVLVYYAGHGYELEDTKAGFWIPSDASEDDPRTWISNSDIARFLALIKAPQIILVSDSCFSGSLAREERLDASQVARRREQILAGRSVVVMTSGGEEPVFDGGGGGHSIFARSLLDTLRGSGGAQVGSSVFADVRQRIESRFPQYPRYGAARSAGHRTGGDYLFEQPGETMR